MVANQMSLISLPLLVQIAHADDIADCIGDNPNTSIVSCTRLLAKFATDSETTSQDMAYAFAFRATAGSEPPPLGLRR